MVMAISHSDSRRRGITLVPPRQKGPNRFQKLLVAVKKPVVVWPLAAVVAISAGTELEVRHNGSLARQDMDNAHEIMKREANNNYVLGGPARFSEPMTIEIPLREFGIAKQRMTMTATPVNHDTFTTFTLEAKGKIKSPENKPIRIDYKVEGYYQIKTEFR